jgi:hypothetical protein
MRDASPPQVDPETLRDGVDGWELLTYDWAGDKATMVYGLGPERVKVVRDQPLGRAHGVFTVKRPAPVGRPARVRA